MKLDHDPPWIFHISEDVPLSPPTTEAASTHLVLIDENPERFGSQLLDAHLRGIP